MKNFMLRSISFIRGVIVGAAVVYGIVMHMFCKVMHEEKKPTYGYSDYAHRSSYHL